MTTRGSRRTSGCRRAAQLVLLASLLTIPALAQESQKPPEPAPTDAADQDTNPLRPVFWSLRQEYYNSPGDLWGLVTIVRKDAAILEKRGIGSERGVILRLDAPVVQVVGAREVR